MVNCTLSYYDPDLPFQVVQPMAHELIIMVKKTTLQQPQTWFGEENRKGFPIACCIWW